MQYTLYNISLLKNKKMVIRDFIYRDRCDTRKFTWSLKQCFSIIFFFYLNYLDEIYLKKNGFLLVDNIK